MRRTRQLIAVALVATALCADRAVANAPQLPSSESVASRIASRLTSGLRRAVSTVRIYQPRQDTLAPQPLAASRISTLALTKSHQTFSASQFRLPPPAL